MDYKYNILLYASDRLRNDKEIVLLAISKNSASFEFASDRLKDDEDVVRKALDSFGDGDLLEKASDRLKYRKDIILHAAENGIPKEMLVRMTSPKFYEDIDFVKRVLELQFEILDLVSPKLFKNIEFVCYILKKFGFRHIEHSLPSDRNELIEFMTSVFRHDWTNIKKLPESLRDSVEIVKGAVQQDWRSIVFCSDRVQALLSKDYVPNIDDIRFTHNKTGNKTSPEFLHNDEKYLVHYVTIEHREYPMIWLPKGTLLYTCTNSANAERYVYGSEDDDRENDLKFFYPCPYAHHGVVGFDYRGSCNIVVLSEDIQVLVLLSPAPQSRGFMRNLKNSFSHGPLDAEDYYSHNKVVRKCPLREYDLCINSEIRKKYNIQGQMCIAMADSISEGKSWQEILDLRKRFTFDDALRELILKSCMVGTRDIDSDMFSKNLSEIKNRFKMKKVNLNRGFSVPEIAISPIKTRLLKKGKKDYERSDWNYRLLESLPVNDHDVKFYLEKISQEILQNRQSPLLTIYKPEKDENYSFFRTTIPLAEDIPDEDIDYLRTYKEVAEGGKRNDYFCAFESVLYHVRKSKNVTLKGGSSTQTITHNQGIVTRKATSTITMTPSSRKSKPLYLDKSKVYDREKMKKARLAKFATEPTRKMELPDLERDTILQLTTNNIPILFFGNKKSNLISSRRRL